jgi:DNA-binding transcriptional MerR regulator
MTRTDSANGAGTANDVGAMSDARTWTIAEVAEEFSITHRTVRHYEELNLISPERRGTARIYHRRERTRLNLILRGKRLGFPLQEIRTIIDLYDEPTGQASQLRYVLDQLHERRGNLERRRRDIEEALSELNQFERRCQSDLEKLGQPGRQPGPST